MQVASFSKGPKAGPATQKLLISRLWPLLLGAIPHGRRGLGHALRRLLRRRRRRRRILRVGGNPRHGLAGHLSSSALFAPSSLGHDRVPGPRTAARSRRVMSFDMFRTTFRCVESWFYHDTGARHFSPPPQATHLGRRGQDLQTPCLEKVVAQKDRAAGELGCPQHLLLDRISSKQRGS